MNEDHDYLASSSVLTTKTCCSFCQEKIANFFMIEHLFLHLNFHYYKCNEINCVVEFPTERTLEMHSRIKHGKTSVSFKKHAKFINLRDFLQEKVVFVSESLNAVFLPKSIYFLLSNRCIFFAKSSVSLEQKNDFREQNSLPKHVDSSKEAAISHPKSKIRERRPRKYPIKRKRCGYCNKYFVPKSVNFHILKHLRDEKELKWTLKCLLCDFVSIYRDGLVNRHIKRVHGIVEPVKDLHFIDNRENYRSLIVSKKSLWF